MRTELLALSPDSLAELTNRGLVKRATRDLERAAPVLSENEAGTIAAAFADGVTTELPVGGLEAGRCSCGALGVCRHVVALVLAYAGQGASGATVGKAADAARSAVVAEKTVEVDHPEGTASGVLRVAEGDATEPAEAEMTANWSPASFTDEQLEAHLGKRAWALARRTQDAGYVAHVRRASATNLVPSVDLPSATVRFHVPGDLGFARSDAAAGTREDMLALAVWAFRKADELSPGKSEVHVQVGGSAASDGGAALLDAKQLAAIVLEEGAVNLENGLSTRFTTVRAALDGARLRWPQLALDDLEAQLRAYQERSARYRPEALADHIAELFARHRAVKVFNLDSQDAQCILKF